MLGSLRAVEIQASLRDFQNRMEAENRSLPRLPPPQYGVPDDIFRPFLEKYRSEYNSKFVDQALSIASEIMSRIVAAAPPSRIHPVGARKRYHKSLSAAIAPAD